jgi:DNA-directed RNA polymerase specialized sigma24 family protein
MGQDRHDPAESRNDLSPPSCGDGSVTRWIGELREGDGQQAQQELWNRYFQRLAGLARSRMPRAARREADEEDVALSALDSFFTRVQRGEFPQLVDRTGLWPLLARITAFKAVRQVQREQAVKRGGQKVVRLSEQPADVSDRLPDWEEVISREPTPDFNAQMEEQVARLLGGLPEAVLREVAILKVEGFENQEIADRLKVSLRTVERKLARIRTLWLEQSLPCDGWEEPAGGPEQRPASD